MITMQRWYHPFVCPYVRPFVRLLFCPEFHVTKLNPATILICINRRWSLNLKKGILKVASSDGTMRPRSLFYTRVVNCVRLSTNYLTDQFASVFYVKSTCLGVSIQTLTEGSFLSLLLAELWNLVLFVRGKYCVTLIISWSIRYKRLQIFVWGNLFLLLLSQCLNFPYIYCVLYSLQLLQYISSNILRWKYLKSERSSDYGGDKKGVVYYKAHNTSFRQLAFIT